MGQPQAIVKEILKKASGLLMDVILIIPPLVNTSPFISCGSLFKLLIDKHSALNLTEPLKSIFFYV